MKMNHKRERDTEREGGDALVVGRIAKLTLDQIFLTNQSKLIVIMNWLNLAFKLAIILFKIFLELAFKVISLINSFWEREWDRN